MIQDNIIEFEPGKFFAMVEVKESKSVFDSDKESRYATMFINGHKYEYCLFGDDDQLPFETIEHIGKDEVMSQNKFFNILTCYGSGLRYIDVNTAAGTKDPEIRQFIMRNSFPRLLLEMTTDMKYFFFSVAVIIVSKDGKKINAIRHKEACYCRLEKPDEDGNIRHVFFGNFRDGAPRPEETEIIPLLDEIDPLGDLCARMGREPDKYGRMQQPTQDRKFAILIKFPTPGNQIYPTPYYTAIFRGDWYDIKQMIGLGKKQKIKNHAPIKYQVEIHRDYWKDICQQENITDPVKKIERINKEKENIKNFITGVENSGKLWISNFYVDPTGKEVRMVRINLIDSSKEGGDWAEDIQEASNMQCYSDNIHPNLVGAVPGKAQMNNSGSDKRELFTLKQALEVSFKDLMNSLHELVIHYNGWQDKVYPDIPMILLTTLDQHTDAVEKKSSEL